jgi:hypothetical protein
MMLTPPLHLILPSLFQGSVLHIGIYKYSEADIKSMLGFLVDNIYVVFGDRVFQQSVEIPMGTNCAPLLANVLLYSYEAEFVQKLLRDNNKN